MDISALRKEELTAWVPFERGVEVEIRYLSTEELDELTEKAKTTTWRKHQKTEEVDGKKLFRLIGRAAIKDWKGFRDGDKDFPCTPENIDFVMVRYTGFARFVQDTATEYSAFVEHEQEEEEKNSGLTSGRDEISLG